VSDEVERRHGVGHCVPLKRYEDSQTDLANAEAEIKRLAEQVLAEQGRHAEEAQDVERVRRERDMLVEARGLDLEELEQLRPLKAAIDAAHLEHLKTGDYYSLGMAVQDALLAFRTSGGA
jgi:ribosomal 30S subunit maturation factor RimM